MSRRKIEVGDYITFTATTRDGRRKARRKVKAIGPGGYPEVGYFGYSNFIVGSFPGDKIHKVEKDLK